MIGEYSIPQGSKKEKNTLTATGDWGRGRHFQRHHVGEGTTLVLVTHDPILADYAGRRIVLRDGLIISDQLNAERKAAPPPPPTAVAAGV